MVVKDYSINIQNLSIEYHDYNRDKLFSMGKVKSFLALNKINCKIYKGENTALIGKNGAGKSTLLKCIAGLLRPSEGEIETKGRVIMLSGSDPGFLPHLTGRQNIVELAGAYGVREKKIPDFVSSIEKFANIGEAMDRNYKGYSSGMAGKIGFGFITSLNPDILLIDETLGVGDLEFRKKAADRLEDFINRSGTVIISTHSLNLAKNMCNRGILLEKGELIFDGASDEAVSLHIKNSKN